MENGRYKLNLFSQKAKHIPDYLKAQEISDNVFTTSALYIPTLAVDFPRETSLKYRKELESKWIDVLPKLNNVKFLSVRHRVTLDYFDAICKMKNLEHLTIDTSVVENISGISKLKKLERLYLDSFSRLRDVSPILKLKKLRLLAIGNSFKIINYDSIGRMTWLNGLSLNGNDVAPKNLRIKSLKPFRKLKNLRHLDLSSSSVIDNSYETILELGSLERLDVSVKIPKPLRELIKARHKKLKAGSFIDYDWDNQRFYEGKEW